MTTHRERDGRALVRDLLERTGAFDGVYLSGLPEDRGLPSGHLRAAAVEPGETALSSPWDDAPADPLFTCRLEPHAPGQARGPADPRRDGRAAPLRGRRRPRWARWERPRSPAAPCCGPGPGEGRRPGAGSRPSWSISTWSTAGPGLDEPD
ncbi:MAG: hypothetical protein U0790_23845 [Isosphaeraceae bacterium]